MLEARGWKLDVGSWKLEIGKPNSKIVNRNSSMGLANGKWPIRVKSLESNRSRHHERAGRV